MNLIHTKWRIRKSLKTHLRTVTSFCSHLVQQLLGSEAVEPLEPLQVEVATPPAAEAVAEAVVEGMLIPLSTEDTASSFVPEVATLPLAIILSQQTLPNLELSSILESSTVVLSFMPLALS